MEPKKKSRCTTVGTVAIHKRLMYLQLLGRFPTGWGHPRNSGCVHSYTVLALYSHSLSSFLSSCYRPRPGTYTFRRRYIYNQVQAPVSRPAGALPSGVSYFPFFPFWWLGFWWLGWGDEVTCARFVGVPRVSREHTTCLWWCMALNFKVQCTCATMGHFFSSERAHVVACSTRRIENWACGWIWDLMSSIESHLPIWPKQFT